MITFAAEGRGKALQLQSHSCNIATLPIRDMSSVIPDIQSYLRTLPFTHFFLYLTNLCVDFIISPYCLFTKK